MKKMNPFPYSFDNKRYHTWNYYLQNRFNSKVFKVPISANFSCPNRDGKCGSGGCTFCGTLGSGETISSIQKDPMIQFDEGIETMLHKWPLGRPIAYFQAYTNTYAPLEELKEMFDPFIQREDILALAIATRPDCLEDDKIDYLQSLTKEKEIWVELGLQSIYDETALRVNRGHDYACFEDCVQRLSKTDIKICVHLINSLPNETEEMMINSAKTIGKLPIHAVKIHMLHIMEDTQIALEYAANEFTLQTRDEYVSTIVKQLEVLPKELVIQRLTGDGIADELIAPEWTKKKTIVLNEIDKLMAKIDTYQGKALEEA